MDNSSFFQPTTQGRLQAATKGSSSKYLTSAPHATPQAQKNMGGIGGFLVNNAPAIGAGLGAVAGIPLDIFGGAGSLAGGAVGAGIGEHLKQNLLGTNQGNFGAQLGQDLIQAGEAGALGSIGKGIGAARSAAKGALGIAGKEAPAVADQVAPKASGNVLQRMLDKKATSQAQGVYNDKVMQEFGNGGKLQANNGMQINQILGNMNDHNIQPGIVNMAKYGNAGYGYNDFLNHAIVPEGRPVALDLNKVIRGSFIDQPGLGAVGTKGTQATQIAQGLRRTVLDSLAPEGEISGEYHPGDLLKAAQDLYNAEPASKAEAKVYASARKALINAAGKEGGLNAAIKGTKLPSVEQLDTAGGQALPGATTTQHFLEQAGGNRSLAQEMVDNVNKAQTLQDIQKAEVKHVAANEVANSHAEAVGRALPGATDHMGRAQSYSLTGNGGISTAYEMGMVAHGNPYGLLPLAAKAGATSKVGKAIAKFGNADMSKVGPRVPPDLAALGQEGAPAAEEAVGQAAPEAAMPAEQPAAPPTVPTTPTNLLKLQRPSGYRGEPGAVAAHLPTATAAANALMPGAKKALGGSLGFGARMLAAPIGAPVRTAGQVLKQGVGRAVGDAMGPQPVADNSVLPGPGVGTDQSQGTDALSGITSGAGQDQTDQGSPYSEQNMLADIARDPKNAATYMSIYKTVNPGASKAPLTAAQTTSAMGIRDAAGSIQNYVNGIQQLQKSGHAGYGTGAVNSLLGHMGIGAENQQVYALDSQKTDIATQLAKATTGGKPSAQAIKQWEESLPSINDPAGVVQDKLNSLAANLGTYYSSATTPIGVGQ